MQKQENQVCDKRCIPTVQGTTNRFTGERSQGQYAHEEGNHIQFLLQKAGLKIKVRQESCNESILIPLLTPQ